MLIVLMVFIVNLDFSKVTNDSSKQVKSEAIEKAVDQTFSSCQQFLQTYTPKITEFVAKEMQKDRYMNFDYKDESGTKILLCTSKQKRK